MKQNNKYVRQIDYLNQEIRAIVSLWGKTNLIDVHNQLLLHLSVKFKIHNVVITEAKDQGEHLLITLLNPIWDTPREFALSNEGSLIW